MIKDRVGAVFLAQARLRTGDPHGATTLLATVLAAEPDDVAALILVSQARLALDEPDDALIAARRAVELAPATGPALSALATALGVLGRHEEAIAAAERAVVAEPGEPHRHSLLAWAYLNDGRQLAEAEAAARRAIELAPGAAWFRVTYAMVMKRAGFLDRARAALRDALAREPDNAVARHELAALDVAGWGLGRLARGARGFADALRVSPGQRMSRVWLDETLRRFLNGSTIVLGLLALAGWRAAAHGHAPVARLFEVAAVLAPLLAGWYFATRLGRSLRGYLRTVVLADRYRLVTVVAALAGVLALAGVAFPCPPVLECATLAALCARLFTVVSRHQPAELWLGVTGAICALPAVILVLTAGEDGLWAYTLAFLIAVTGVALVIRMKVRQMRHG